MKTGPQNIDPMETLLRDVREISAAVGKVREALGGESLADVLAQWLTVQYARVIKRLIAEAAASPSTGSGPDGLPVELLRKLNADVAVLRKGDHRARQLELYRERNEIERMKTREGKEKEFVAWRKERRHEEKPRLTPEERERKMRKIFGLRDDIRIPRPPREDWRRDGDQPPNGDRRGPEAGGGEGGEAAGR